MDRQFQVHHELGSRRDNATCSTDCQDHHKGEPIDLEDEGMAAKTGKLKLGWIQFAQLLGDSGGLGCHSPHAQPTVLPSPTPMQTHPASPCQA